MWFESKIREAASGSSGFFLTYKWLLFYISCNYAIKKRKKKEEDRKREKTSLLKVFWFFCCCWEFSFLIGFIFYFLSHTAALPVYNSRLLRPSNARKNHSLNEKIENNTIQSSSLRFPPSLLYTSAFFFSKNIAKNLAIILFLTRFRLLLQLFCCLFVVVVVPLIADDFVLVVISSL